MSVFKIVEVVASPEYRDYETGEILMVEDLLGKEVIGLDVVEYDNGKGIVTHLECFTPHEIDKAKKALEFYENLDLGKL